MSQKIYDDSKVNGRCLLGNLKIKSLLQAHINLSASQGGGVAQAQSVKAYKSETC